MFMEPRNRFQGINSAGLCSLAGRYDNPLPPRFLAPIDSLKIPAQRIFHLWSSIRSGPSRPSMRPVFQIRIHWIRAFWRVRIQILNFDYQKFKPSKTPHRQKRNYIHYTVDDTIDLQNMIFLGRQFLPCRVRIQLPISIWIQSGSETLHILLAFALVSSFGEGGTFLYLERHLSDTLWTSELEFFKSLWGPGTKEE
jgi:hypothetical protein